MPEAILLAAAVTAAAVAEVLRKSRRDAPWDPVVIAISAFMSGG
jgi:hypothetical protein